MEFEIRTIRKHEYGVALSIYRDGEYLGTFAQVSKKSGGVRNFMYRTEQMRNEDVEMDGHKHFEIIESMPIAQQREFYQKLNREIE